MYTYIHMHISCTVPSWQLTGVLTLPGPHCAGTCCPPLHFIRIISRISRFPNYIHTCTLYIYYTTVHIHTWYMYHVLCTWHTCSYMYIHTCTVQYSTVVLVLLVLLVQNSANNKSKQQVHTINTILHICAPHTYMVYISSCMPCHVTVRVPHPIKQKTQILFVSRDVKTQNGNVQCYTT